MNYPHAPITECSVIFWLGAFDAEKAIAYFTKHVEAAGVFDEFADVVTLEGPAPETGDPSPEVRLARRTAGRAARATDQSRELTLNEQSLRFTMRGKYDAWEPFSAEALDWLSRLDDDALRPAEIWGISAQFTNHLPTPDADYEIADYVRFNLNIPSLLPQKLTEIATSVTLQLTDAATTEVSVYSRDTSQKLYPDLYLEIDTRLRVTIDMSAGLDGRGVKDALDELRELKNQVFEASITDGTRNLLKWGDHAG